MVTMGGEGDISNICMLKWFEWTYYCEGSAKFTFGQEVLGKVLGPAKNHGSEMAQWILKPNGQVVPWQLVRRLTDLEMTNNPIEERKRQAYMEFIRSNIGNSISLPSSLTKDDVEFIPYEDDEEIPRVIPENEAADANGLPVMQQSVNGKMIQLEVLLPHGEGLKVAKGRTSLP